MFQLKQAGLLTVVTFLPSVIPISTFRSLLLANVHCPPCRKIRGLSRVLSSSSVGQKSKTSRQSCVPSGSNLLPWSFQFLEAACMPLLLLSHPVLWLCPSRMVNLVIALGPPLPTQSSTISPFQAPSPNLSKGVLTCKVTFTGSEG